MGDVAVLTIGKGCDVSMNFTLTIEDGTIADASELGEPLAFRIGDGTLIEGLEMMLYGMKAGERQYLLIGPQDAFGYPDPDNIHRMPRAEFDASFPLEMGTIIGFTTPSGEEVPGTIMAVEGDEVVVDFNHPLAGHNITFDVEIVSVKPAQG